MKRLFTILFLLVVFASTEAQKIKYKDLFFILDTQNYKDGEPILRRFLSDPKNINHPNGNLQMAFIYDKKVQESDVILESDKLVAYADSAITYYRNALLYINEKEVKKNDEYYQAYQRRDIRTGKFGIKLADVSFDLENKIKLIEDRKANTQELQLYSGKTIENFEKALAIYKEIKTNYPTEKILYLRSNDGLVIKLGELRSSSNLALSNYKSFEAALKKIDKSGYGPALHITKIEDYEKDGVKGIALTDDNIYFWDYSAWAEEVKDGVEKVVTPMRAELVEYDNSLNSLIERVETDSMSMIDRAEPLGAVLAKIREYDPDPLPEYLFEYKVAKLDLESFNMDHLHYKDSSDILYRQHVTTTKYDKIKEMDSLVNLLIGRDALEDEKNYAYFITTQYKNMDGLNAYVKKELDATISAKKSIETEMETLNERTNWLIGESDSIPLFEDVNIGLSKYAPLIRTEDFTSGLYFSGKTAAEGYFALIDRTLSQGLKVNFPIDNVHFKKQNFEDIRTLSVKEESGHYYFILFHYQLPEQEEHAATIAKIYTSDGLAWAKNITLDTEPLELLINDNTGDLVIEYDLDNYLGGNDLPDRLVLTKKGDVK